MKENIVLVAGWRVCSSLLIFARNPICKRKVWFPSMSIPVIERGIKQNLPVNQPRYCAHSRFTALLVCAASCCLPIRGIPQDKLLQRAQGLGFQYCLPPWTIWRTTSLSLYVWRSSALARLQWFPLGGWTAAVCGAHNFVTTLLSL